MTDDAVYQITNEFCEGLDSRSAPAEIRDALRRLGERLVDEDPVTVLLVKDCVVEHWPSRRTSIASRKALIDASIKDAKRERRRRGSK